MQEGGTSAFTESQKSQGLGTLSGPKVPGTTHGGELPSGKDKRKEAGSLEPPQVS